MRKCCTLKLPVMPVIVGALGMIKKDTDKHTNKIPGSPSLYEIQEIALCGIAYHVDWKISPNRSSKKHKYLECI